MKHARRLAVASLLLALASGTAVLASGGSVGQLWKKVAGVLTQTSAGDPVALRGSPGVYLESDNGSAAGLSGLATGRLRYNNATGKWEVSTQGGAYQALSTGGGVTLQGAYNGGKSISTSGGPVSISSVTDDLNCLQIAMNPPAVATGGAGLAITMQSPFGVGPAIIAFTNAGGDGLEVYNQASSGVPVRLEQGATSTLAAINVTMDVGSTGAALYLDGPWQNPTGTSLFVESEDGSTSAVSGAATGRLRYNNTTGTWQVSTKGGAWASLTTGTSSLQASYNGGATIVEAGGTGVTLQSTTSDASTVLSVTKGPGTAQSGNAISAGLGSSCTGATLVATTSGSGNAGVFSSLGTGDCLVVSKGGILANSNSGIAVTMNASQSGNGVTITQSGSGLGLLSTGGSISSPGAGASSERYGQGASAAGSNTVAVGNGASAPGNFATSVGYIANAGTRGCAFGYSAVTIATGSVVVGQGSSDGGFRGIVLGDNATLTAAAQALIGGINAPVTDLYLGPGVIASGAPATAITYHATNGSGAGVSGSIARLQGGLAGDAATAGGDVRLGVGVAGTGNALTDEVYVQATTGNVGIGAAPGAFKLDVSGSARIQGKLTVTGAIDPPSVSLSSGTALFFDSADGSTAPVSAANHGRIRYLDGTGWQVSANGGAYATLSTSGGGGAGSLNATLTVGNTTSGKNVVVTTGDGLALNSATPVADGITWGGLYGALYGTSSTSGTGKVSLFVADLTTAAAGTGAGITFAKANLGTIANISGTLEADVTGSRLILQSCNAAGTLTEALRLDESQKATFGGNLLGPSGGDWVLSAGATHDLQLEGAPRIFVRDRTTKAANTGPVIYGLGGSNGSMSQIKQLYEADVAGTRFEFWNLDSATNFQKVLTLDENKLATFGGSITGPTGQQFTVESGSGQSLSLDTQGDNIIYFGTGSGTRWLINGNAGHLVPGTTNTHDLGASATVVRNVYTSTVVGPTGADLLLKATTGNNLELQGNPNIFIQDATADASGTGPVLYGLTSGGGSLAKLEMRWEADVAGSRFVFTNRSSANALQEVLRLDETKLATFAGSLTTTDATLSGVLRTSSNGTASLGAASTGFGALYLDYTNTATVGNVTINKVSGTVNFPALSSTMTVTDSKVTANSHILVTLASDPGVALSVWTVGASGSFTINTRPATVNQTAIDFLVVGAD